MSGTIGRRLVVLPLAFTGLLALSGEIPHEPQRVRPPRTDGPQAAASRRHMLMADESGNIAVDGLMRARASVDQMRAAQLRDNPGMSSVAGINRLGWTWLGPGNKGGRVRAVLVHPTTPSTLFIGSVSGGIWKTTNGGGTWAPIDDFMTNLAVSTMVFTPGDPTIMYAGTGEGFYNFDRIRGAGIFKSVDGGTSWTQLASTANPGNQDFYYVNRLAFSDDGLTLLAATSTGIFRSTNGGANWTRVYTATTARIDILDVKFLPGSSTNAVASGYSTNAYYSTDGGLTWTLAAGIGPAGSFVRVEIGVSPATPATVYLSVDSGSGQIWRSDDSGQSYSMVRQTNHLGGQGWYDNTIWVDPTNTNRVVAAGVFAYRSTDGFATNQTQFTGIHTDFHLFVSDPGYNGTTNKRVYIGNDGGVFRNDDITTGSTFVSLNNNLGITQFYGAGGNTTSGKIIGGTQDNSTVVYWPATGANAWTTPFGGDGGYSAADPNDVNYLYGEVQYGWVHRNTTGGSSYSRYIFGYFSPSPGVSACKAPPHCLTDAWNYTINFIPPLILDPNNANRMLVGGRSLWRSNDVKAPGDSSTGEGTGPMWAAIKPPFGSPTNINTIAVAPGNSDIVWVGHNNPGYLFVTTNGTATTPSWTRVDNNPGGLPQRVVTRIVVDPSNSNVAYVSFGGFNSNNVWRTTNLGATWTQATGTGGTALPAAPVYALAIHPDNPSWIYAGTEVGIFASTDSGATWAVPHDGPANVSTAELFWMGTDLVAVTHGRGLFVTSTDQVFGKTSPPNGATGQSTSPTLAWGVSAGATSYEYCYDTNNNSACDTSWVSTGANTSVGLAGLTAGATYYWHARAIDGGTTYTDGSATAFWSFTTTPPPPPAAFGKTSPSFAATGQSVSPALTWEASTGSVSYEYCYDTSNNDTCNATWTSTGTGRSVALSGLAFSTTYYWHVRAINPNGTTYADGSAAAFWRFTTAAAAPPFGQMDTPAQNASGVQGAIGVTGWALDDQSVNSVQIYRNCLPFEPVNCQGVLGNNVVYVGDAAFLDGARPDVAAAFPNYPNNTRAGWGYLMLTPMLPHVPTSQPFGGQGPLTLYAVATDPSGNRTLLGRTFAPGPGFATPTAITMANDAIAKPFGAIDTPGQGQTISGIFNNFGWVLTPDSNTIADGTDILVPIDGSTMTVFIDGLPVSLVAYNQCRGSVGNPVPPGVYCDDDVSNIFGNPTPQPPGTTRTSNPTRFRNLDAARATIGAYTFDTTTLADGLHTIAWSVTDSAGRNEGIGSRFFIVLNGSPDALRSASEDALRAAPARVLGKTESLQAQPPGTDGVWGRKGFSLATPWSPLHAKEDGTFVVRLPELGRLELWLGAGVDAGYLVAGDSLQPLPVGSSLTGVRFGWMPPAGYTGPYTLVFIRGGHRITVTIIVGAE